MTGQSADKKSSNSRYILLKISAFTPVFVFTAKTRSSIILNSPCRCNLHQMEVIPEEWSSDNVLPEKALHTYQSLTNEMNF